MSSDQHLLLQPIVQRWAECRIFVQDPPGAFPVLEVPEIYNDN